MEAGMRSTCSRISFLHTVNVQGHVMDTEGDSGSFTVVEDLEQRDFIAGCVGAKKPFLPRGVLHFKRLFHEMRKDHVRRHQVLACIQG